MSAVTNLKRQARDNEDVIPIWKLVGFHLIEY